GLLPKLISASCLGKGLDALSTITFSAGTKYALIFEATFTSKAALPVLLTVSENNLRSAPAFLAMPTITTVTPALWLARFAHLNEVWAKAISCPVAKISGHKIGTCWPWQMELVDTNAAAALLCTP